MLTTAKEEFTSLNPLQGSGFSYIFPLLSTLIHQRGRVVKLKEKIRTELIMLAADVGIIG
jgi:hypothetical protein